jgi:stress response protein YsnF
LLSSFGGMSIPEEDRRVYAEGMRRGLTTVVVRVDAARAPAVEETLERNGSVDLDEREASWRSEGLQGDATAAGGGTTTTTTTTAALADTTGTTAGLGAATVREDGVVERAEERLVVGKRQAAGGRVRVRSYVVETPFEEQVTLRDERVHVERRPVDRPVQPGDAVFEERVLEASERSEEAVVTKEARVVEEIGLRKEADTRTETGARHRAPPGGRGRGRPDRAGRDGRGHGDGRDERDAGRRRDRSRPPVIPWPEPGGGGRRPPSPDRDGAVAPNRTLSGPGDRLLIPAGASHRVEWTDPGRPTVWLAMHYG